MNSSLRNKIVAVITGGGGGIAIATAMLSGHDGLEGRLYVAYRDVVGILTVCDGHTGADIIARQAIQRRRLRFAVEI